MYFTSTQNNEIKSINLGLIGAKIEADEFFSV